MKKTLTKWHVGKLFLLAAFVVILLSAVFLGIISYHNPQARNIAEAASDTRGADATSGLSSFTTTYNSKTINLSVGTPTAANISWSAYSEDGQQYSLNLASGKFGVKKGANYAHLNTYVATLNIAVPQWLQDLAASSTLTVTITGDFYCWKDWNKLEDAEFYFGTKQSSSIVKKSIDLSNSTVRDNLNEDSGASFLPNYDNIHRETIDWSIFGQQSDASGTFTSTFILSSTSKYIAIGISGHAGTWPGYSTPESYLQNIKISIPYDGGTTNATTTNIEIKNDDYGSCSYTFYPNATISSVGTATTATLAKGKSTTLTTSNPFAFVVITPIESEAYYRFTNANINNANQTLGYNASNDDPPNQFLISTLTNTTLTNARKGAYGGSYTYAKGSVATKLNFNTLRTYTIVYRANGGQGANQSITYDCNTDYTVPNPATLGFSKEGSVPSSWTYTTDNKTSISNSNRGKTYTPGNTFSNVFNEQKNNAPTIYFDVVWVDVSASKNDDTIEKMEMSAYTDKYSDVTFTITANKTGHTLVQVYATYTSGDIDKQTIALEQIQAPNSKNVSKWVLYGICGNCEISAEWKANTYNITYSISDTYGTIATKGAEKFTYGVGISYTDLSTVTNKSEYVFRGWSTSTADTNILTAASSGTTILASNTENVTLTAIFQSSKAITTRTTATSMSSLTNVTSWSSTSSYVTSGQGISYSSSANTLTGSYFSWGTKHVTYSAPAGLYWCYYSNTDTKPGIGSSNPVSGDNTSLQGYAHYYIALAGDALRAYRAGVPVTIDAEIGYSVACYASGSASKDASSQVILGLQQGFTSGTAISNTINGTQKKASAGTNAWQTATSSLSRSITLTNGASDMPGATIQIRANQTCTKGSTAEYISYAGVTSVKYKITYGGTVNTFTIYGNNGKTEEGNSSVTITAYGDTATLTIPTNFFIREGYEFLGWNTTAATSANATYAPGKTYSTTSSTHSRSLYAIWRQKKYPVITYDVWTDNGQNAENTTHYATTIRKEYYIEHGNTLTFYTDRTNTAYATNSIYHLAGGGDYDGFTVQASPYRIITHSGFKSHEYDYTLHTHGVVTPSTTGVSGAYWGYFIWNLIPPSATTKDAEVDYGTAVDMDTLVMPDDHAAADETFSWVWYNSDGDKVEFYQNHELFTVEESSKLDAYGNDLGTYSVVVTVTVVRGGVALSKKVEVERPAKVIINPLHLVIDASGDRTFEYNGETYEFPLQTKLDEEYYSANGYSADQIEYLISVFESERDESTGRHPWYYDDDSVNNNVEKWRYGLYVNLVGLGYTSYIADGSAEDFYDGTIVGGVRQFKDAGEYWASQLHILKATGSSVLNGNFNKNYIWSKNRDTQNNQIFSAEEAGAEGTVYATITPADGFDLYAFYVQKTFGKIADPTPIALNFTPLNGKFDMENLEYLLPDLNPEDYAETWILAIDGLFDDDFDLYNELIAAKLTRDRSAPLHQKAGLYDVYLDLSLADGTISRDFLRLLNNYGVKLESAASTTVRTGYNTVKMRWVNQDGSIRDGAFDFTTDISAYSGERNNFEIIPKDIELSYNGSQTYTYNGKPQGPNNIISTGYLSEEEKAAFAAEYGDGYERLFEIYFYGIPLPAPSASFDWNAMSAEEQAQYIENHKGYANIVGYEGLNYINSVDDKYAISLFEINAGKYSVVIIGAAYKDADGNFHENVSFNLSSPLYLYWQIRQKAIVVDANYTSMTFGDVNYGGASYTFSGIADEDGITDQIQIKNLAISYAGKSSDGFLRYCSLYGDTHIANNSTYSVYGTFAGDYVVTMGGTVSIGITDATGLYGVADENYGRAETNYTLSYNDTFTISHRNLKVSTTEYSNYITVNEDGSVSGDFSAAIPDMTYVYGRNQGIRIKISDFCAENFARDDIAQAGAENVLISADEIVNLNNIRLTRTHANSTCMPIIDETGTGSVEYFFYAVNAATYSVSITDMTYTYGGKNYGNYDMTERSVSFTVKPKTIMVQWYLDGTAIMGSGIPSVVYDATAHTVTAQLLRANNGVFDTTDNLVYYDDFISATQLYSVYDRKNALSLQFSAEGTNSYTDVNVIDDEDVPYETFLMRFTTGNYRLMESDDDEFKYNLYSISWKIDRREFTISVPQNNLENTFTYDGDPHQIILNLNSGNVEVVLDSFAAITSSSANFRYGTITPSGEEIAQGRLIFNANEKSLSATECGIYWFSYDATTVEGGIKIDKNWLLTGKADYSGIGIDANGQLIGTENSDNTFLFAIVPRVLTLRFNTNVATYSSNNLISRFRATFTDSIVPSDNDTAFTYNLSEIIHAGTYSLSVIGATSASGNFVLAETNPTAWYATIADGWRYDYYSNQDVIDAYSTTVTVNPYTVTIDPIALNNGLKDYVYDGIEHGYTMEYVYETFVKAMLLCDADKAGYTLKGKSEPGTNVGTYEVLIEGFNPFNGYTDYRLAEAEGYSDTWSITKRTLELIYIEYHESGNSYVYDGKNHGYTLTVGNIVDGESITLLFSGSNINITSPYTFSSEIPLNSVIIYGKEAAAYSISNFSLADATVDGTTYASSNYELPEGGANKSWTIQKKVITVEWHNTELTYRASVYNPTNGGVYATVTNSVDGDTFTLNYGGQSSATNKGEYTVSIEDLTGGAYANYTIDGTLSTTWTIKAKELSDFNWTGVGSGFSEPPTLSVTYNGANHSINATPTAGAENADDGKIYDKDAANFTFTYSSAQGYVTTALLAGDYTTKISGCNNPNYTIANDANVEKQWQILKRALTVTYRYNYGTTIAYCAAARGVVLEIGGFIAADFDANLNFAVDTNVASDNGGSASGTVYTRTLRSVNVGDYTASVKIDENSSRASCYELSGTTTAAFKITPLTVVLEWKLCASNHANRTAEYDGNPHELIATVTNLASSNDEVNVTVTGGIQTNQGTYTGVAASLDNDNYALPESESARSCTFTISARSITAIWESTAESYTYNGKYQSDMLTLSRLIAADSVLFKVEFYKESGGTSTLYKTAAVSKNGSVEYDLTAADFKTTIDYGTYVAVFDGKVYNADGTVNTNYKFTPVAENDRTRYTIARATLLLTGVWNYANDAHSGVFNASTVLMYNSKPYTLTTGINSASLFVRDDTAQKDEVTIVYTGNVNTHVGAGKYTAAAASLSGTYASNYRLPTEGISVSYAITPKGVNLVWENYEGIIYDGQTHTVTAKVQFGGANDTDGLAYDNDEVSVSDYENNAYRAANSYTSTALSLDNDDYVILSGGTLDWKIDPRSVSLNWSPDTVEYDGTVKAVTATVSNRVSGDTITLTYRTEGTDYLVTGAAAVGNVAINAGTYLTAVTALSNSNYTLEGGTNTEHEWVITPIVLEFGWSSGSGLSYNGSAQGITLTVSNIAEADFENADRLSFIAAATPENSQTVTENRTVNPIKISFRATNAGTYTITVSELGGTSAENYVLPDNKSASYTIAKRVIDIDWSAGTFVYSKQNHEVTAGITNLVGDDEVNLTYRTTGTGYSVSGAATVGNVAMNAGSYSTVVTAVDNANYTVTGANDLTCDWTISPKTITAVTFTLDGQEELTTTYNHVTHVLTATAEDGAESDDDGKIYDGDSVTFAYTGSVTTNYGISAINKNSAIEAGEYSVSIEVDGNDNYTVESVSCGFTVNRRTLTLSSEDVTTTAFVYDGKAQGVKVIVNNLVEYDNNSTRFSLDVVISPSGTVESSVRSGANYSKRALAVSAGTYTLSFGLNGTRYQNYELTPFDCEFTITRKQITTQISADITADNITYSAKPIDASDLSVTFNNLITGERLTLGDDFSVSFAKDGEDLGTAPINVGVYTAKISLKSDGNASVNYELIGTTDFEFEIIPYEITPSMLTWALNGNTVRLDSLTFKEGESKTIAVSEVNDDVFNTIAGKAFSYLYFGLCNCGLDAKSSADLDEEHLAHQWFAPDGNFRTEGPEHAGSYFVVLTLSDGDADNFTLAGFEGYTGNYIHTEDGEAYLAYYRSAEKFTGTPLPKLGGSTQAMRFGIGRLQQGVVVEGVKSNLPFKGTAYTVGTGLPEVTAENTSNIRVEIGSGTYTYEEYSAAAFNAIKNAGEYSIKIYDNSASGDSGTVSGCDLFNSDAEMQVTMTLTVDKAKITVTDTSEPYWSKVYDHSTSYSGYSYNKNVTFSSTTDGDGNIIATSDGVLAGTTVNISAAYDSYNAGTRTLTFTLSGTDRGNYYIALSENGTVLEAGTDYTVNGYTYAINDAEITKRVIGNAGDADKVFDGNKSIYNSGAADFTIISSDILSGDTVKVTGEYASEHVGTHDITVTTVSNENYDIVGLKGTISPKSIAVVWANTDSTTPTYDGNAHGVTATVSGMIEGYIEDITAAASDSHITVTKAYPVFTFTGVNAGDYSVALSLKDDSDYSLSSDMNSADLTIAQRVIDVSWITDNEADGAYIYEWDGFTVPFANVERYITPQISNLVGEDDVQLTVRNNRRTLVGSSTAEITAISGEAAANYTLSATRTQVFTIIKATITSISLDDLTAVYNGEAQGVEISSYVTQHGITINVRYDGGEAKTAGTINGDNAFINVTGDEGQKITATLGTNDYYEPLTLEATVIITPSPITSITLASRTFVYDDQNHSISVNTDVTNYGDKVTVTYTIVPLGGAQTSDIALYADEPVEGNSAKDAGKYTVVATIAADNPNYITLTRTAIMTIEKADIDESRITVNADSGTIIYDAQLHGVIITVLDNKTQYGHDVTITYYGGDNNSGQAKNVGRYEINAVVSAGDNYNEYTTEISVLTITQKEIDITLAEADRRFTYDGRTHTARVTFEMGAQNATDKKVYDGDSMTIRLTYLGTSGVVTGDTVLKNSGTYTMTAELSNRNYRATTNTVEIIIDKATIEGYYFVGNSFPYNNRTRVLGINTENAYTTDIIRSLNLLSTDVGSVTYTYTTAEGGEYDTVFAGAKNVGTYYLKATITADGDAAGNYEAWEEYAVLKITPALLTSFTMEEVSVTYNGLAHSIDVTVADPDKQLIDGVYYTAYGDKVYVSYTINDGKSDDKVGNSAVNVNIVDGAVTAYTVTAHCSFDEDVKNNYRDENLEISTSLTISPATLRNFSLTGEDTVYDGNAHYATLSLPAASGYPRYEFNADKTEITVYLADGHAGDVFTVTQYIEDYEGAAIDAGSYDFVAHIALKDSELSGNYTAISDLRKTIVIARAQAADASGTVYQQNVNIFFNDVSVEYCGATHYIVLAFENALSDKTHNIADVLTSIMLHPSTNTAVSDETDITYLCEGAEFEGAKAVGTYVITARVSHKNYQSFTLQGTITITKAFVEYYFTGDTITYDMATHFAAVSTQPNTYVDDGSVTTISLRGSDTATVRYTYKLNGTEMGAFNGALYVGDYEITATLTFIGDVGENYEIWGTDDSITAHLIITPYQTEIVWVGLDRDYVYNGNPFPAVTARFTGADGTTIVEATVSYEGISGKAAGDTSMKNAGVYKLTASHARANNYTFVLPEGQQDGAGYTFVSATEVNLTVKKATIVRYLVNNSRPYAATTYYLTLSSSTAANVLETYSDTITVYGETINIIYTYTKSGANNKDYYMNDEGVKTTLEYGARNAGTYTVTADLDLGDGESNFESWASPKSATLTITRLNLTVTSTNDFVKTYDGTKEVTDYVINGVINSADHITYIAEYSDKNAGDSKPITISANTADDYAYLKDNYNLPSNTTGTIEQRQLNLIESDNEADDQTSLVFWRKLYDGVTATKHSPLTLIADNNFIEGDALTLTSRYNSKNVKEANKVLFTLAGADRDNYTIAGLDFTAQVDVENGVYLIIPRDPVISWSSATTAYNGRTQTVSATLALVGEDAAIGQLNLAISLQYTKYGNGVELENPIDNAVYRNAGTYVATASIPGGTDENMQANYSLTADAVTRIFTITRQIRTVVWSGLSAGAYTYNGTDQGVGVKATVTLLGDDVNTYKDIEYITIVFSNNGDETEFKNAGDYDIVARFADSVYAELSNNYTLTNANNSKTMNKATINNITFSGTDSWTYSNGTVHYYFVSDKEGQPYIVKIGNDGISVPVIKYQYDDIEMEIDYSGGDRSLDEINGNNGIRNVGTGSRTITATVSGTDNYESWTGEITVTVAKGKIDNVEMKSYEVIFDGARHYLYARNVGASVGDGESSQIKAPDGSTLNVTYVIEILEYCYEGFEEAHSLNANYAINAGLYSVEATVTSASGNYETLVLPSADGEPVTLSILQFKGAVIWAYNGQTTPNFTYNATNQTSSVRASILGASTSGSQNRIQLAVAITMLDEIDIPEALKSQFVIAGSYSMTADFSSADESEYNKLRNNYELSNQTVSVTMKKFVVEIKWYYNPKYHNGVKELYDPENPCIYDAQTHGLIAEGMGIGDDDIMEIITAGIFDAIDATDSRNPYRARVDRIAEGTDTVSVDGVSYEFKYELNYTLANKDMSWHIAPRPITISAAEDNFLSKIYDGSAVFGFDANAYTKSFITDTADNNVVNILVTYNTLRSAYYNSHFSYYINNVMAVDKDSVFLPIASISADRVNVLAANATVALGGLLLELNSNQAYNYIIDSVSNGIIQINEDVITPRDVEMRFQNLSHIYNGHSYSHEFTYAEKINGGLQFNQKYGYNLFLFYSTSSVRMQLVDGNYLTGNVSIGGNINAGEYHYVISDLKVVDAETDGAENYNIIMTNLDTTLYTIEKRKLAVNYTNLLQSRQEAFSDITVSLDLTNSQYKDLIVGENEDALSVLTDLVLTRDKFELSVQNAWKEQNYTDYTRILGNVALVGETVTAPLTVFVNSGNYAVDAPILQITYLQIENADEYKFFINNLDDLLHLDADNYGLNEMLENTDIIPTYTQTADIDGLVNGSYTVMTSIRNFRGYYLGKNHSISNMVIEQVFDSDDEDSAYAGFFARITKGEVKELKLTGIHVYALSGVSSAGGFAGLIGTGVAVENVDFNGTLYVYADYDGEEVNKVQIGGFVGTALNAQITNVNVAVKMTVVHENSDTLYVGGFAGYIDGGKYENIFVFADANVLYNAAPALGAYFGGIAGYVTGDGLVLNNYRYLSASVYVNDGNNAMLYDKAFGNDVTFDAAAGTLYDAFVAANDALSELISTYMIRSYLLPSGADGTAAHPVEITNFRQIALMLAYPYMSFNVTRDVRCPMNIITYHRGFYGTITYVGGSIRSDHPDNSSDKPLHDAVKNNTQTVIIGKKEDNH